MKSLIRILIVVVITTFLVSCGKDNKVGSSSSASSSSTLNSSDSGLNGFYSKVVNQQFATVYGNYDWVEFTFNDLYYDYAFTREYDRSTGAIYRDDDGYNTKSAIVNFLSSIITNRQNYRVGCDVYPSYFYGNIFQRSYNYQDCYTFLRNNVIYYIDLNYPLEANPVATIKQSVTQDKWWIFKTYSTTVDGYYLYDISVDGF